MKTVIEASAYLLIFTYIAFISLDFISINKDISEKNNSKQLVVDVVELYGQNEEDGFGENNEALYKLDSNSFKKAEAVANAAGMTLECRYMGETDRYVYYVLDMDYKVKANFFNLDRVNTYQALARVEK